MPARLGRRLIRAMAGPRHPENVWYARDRGGWAEGEALAALDGEARRLDGRERVAGRVASAADGGPDVCAIGDLENAPQWLARGMDVLVEAELAAGTKRAPRLCKRCSLVRNGAQHERCDDCVHGPVLDGERLGSTGHDADWHPGLGRRARSLLAKARLGLDRDHLGHGLWIEREVRSVAGTELDGNAGESRERATAMFVLPTLDGAAAVAAVEPDEERIADISGLPLRHRSRCVERHVLSEIVVLRRNRFAALAVAAALTGGSLSACGADEEVSPVAVRTLPPVRQASELAQRANTLLDGGPAAFKAQLAALRGTPVVVNQWASWCGPCRLEFPFFRDQARKYDGRVAFLGVNSKDSLRPASKFLKTIPVPFPHYVDKDAEIARVFKGGRSWPTTAFYDASGELVFTHQGQYRSAEDLEADITRYALDG